MEKGKEKTKRKRILNKRHLKGLLGSFSHLLMLILRMGICFLKEGLIVRLVRRIIYIKTKKISKAQILQKEQSKTRKQSNNTLTTNHMADTNISKSYQN